MADTIRDVVIRVSIEAGKSNLDGLNAQVQSTIKAMQDQIADAFHAGGGGSIPGGRTVYGGRRPGNWRGAMTSAEAQSIVANAGLQNDLRDRMNAEEFLAGGAGDPSSAKYRHAFYKKRERTKEKTARDVAAAEKAEQDRIWQEAEKGVATWSRIKKEQAAKQREAVQSTIGLARGLGHLGAASGVIPGDLAHVVVAIEGLANVGKSATGVMEAMGAGSIVLGSGLAVLVAELMLTKHAFEQTRDIMHSYYASMTDEAQRSVAFQGAQATRHHSQASSLAMAMHNPAAYDRFLTNFGRYEEREQAIREYENRNVPEAFKASFRQRMEHRGGLEEQRSAAEDEIKFKKEQISKLQTAREQLARDTRNATGLELGQRPTPENLKNHPAVTAADQAIRNAKYESVYGAAGRFLYRHSAGYLGERIGFNVGVDRNSGLFNSQATAVEAAQERKMEIERDIASVADKNNAQALQSAEQERKLREEILETEQRRLGTTREIQQAAYAAVQSEKERLRSENIHFGSMHVGDQHFILRMQAKHDQIEAQKQRNRTLGLPEDANLPQYSQYEINRGAGGSVAGVTMREQAQRTAAKMGFRPETNIKELETEFQNELSNNLISEMKKGVADSAERAKEAGRQMADAMLNFFSYEDVVAGFEKRLAEERASHNQSQMVRQATFGQ